MTLTGIGVGVILTKIQTNDAAPKSGFSVNWEIFPACLSYVDRCLGDITSGSNRRLGSINFAPIKAASPANEKVQYPKSRIQNEAGVIPILDLELRISDSECRISNL